MLKAYVKVLFDKLSLETEEISLEDDRFGDALEIISKGKGIEINTSGYRYGEDRVYPDFEILKKYFELGGEVITIGSDSHRKEDITKDFKTTYEILERLGVKYISSFEKMEPSFIKIR